MSKTFFQKLAELKEKPVECDIAPPKKKATKKKKDSVN